MRLLQIRQAFQFFDKDQSGELDARELHPCLLRLGLEATPSETAAIVRKYDTSGDGLLSLVEFSKLVADVRQFVASRPPAVEEAVRDPLARASQVSCRKRSEPRARARARYALRVLVRADPLGLPVLRQEPLGQARRA